MGEDGTTCMVRRKGSSKALRGARGAALRGALWSRGLLRAGRGSPKRHGKRRGRGSRDSDAGSRDVDTQGSHRRLPKLLRRRQRLPGSGSPPGRGSRRPLAQPLPLVTEVVLTSETGRDANALTAGAGYGASIWGDKGDPQHVTRKGARLQN